MTNTNTAQTTTMVDRCPICKVTRNCEPSGCLKCHLAGKVDTGIERQRIELPCECGATMVGEADVATREVAMEYHTAKAGEPIRFHFLECASCGSYQVS